MWLWGKKDDHSQSNNPSIGWYLASSPVSRQEALHLYRALGYCSLAVYVWVNQRKLVFEDEIAYIMTYSQRKKYNNMQEILLAGCHLLFWEYLKKKTSVYTLKPWQETGGVLSRNYLLGEKSRMAEGHELPRGVREHAPPPPKKNVLKWIRTEMQSGAFWDTILRNVTVYALRSSRLDDFFNIVTYIQ